MPFYGLIRFLIETDRGGVIIALLASLIVTALTGSFLVGLALLVAAIVVLRTLHRA